MSVTVAEAENTNQVQNDAGETQFNGDLLDISTVNGVGLKQPIHDNVEDDVAVQSSPEDASTKTGATEDKIESFSSSQGVHEAEIPSMPEKEVATEGSSPEEASLEHSALELTPAQTENHELVGDLVSEVEKDVAVEEPASAPDSGPLLNGADASTIDHASSITPDSSVLINNLTPSATEMAVKEDASGTVESEAPVSDPKDTSYGPAEVASDVEPLIHGAVPHPAEDVVVEKVPEADAVPPYSEVAQDEIDHIHDSIPATTEDVVVEDATVAESAPALDEEETAKAATLQAASTTISEAEPSPAVSASSEDAPDASESAPTPLEVAPVADSIPATEDAVEEAIIPPGPAEASALDENVPPEVPSETLVIDAIPHAADVVVEETTVTDSAPPSSTEVPSLNEEVAPAADSIPTPEDAVEETIIPPGSAEAPVLDEDVPPEVPSETLVIDAIPHAADVVEETDSATTEVPSLNEDAPITDSVTSAPEEAVTEETVDAPLSSAELPVLEETVNVPAEVAATNAEPSAVLIDHPSAEEFEEEAIESEHAAPVSTEVSIPADNEAEIPAEIVPAQPNLASAPSVVDELVSVDGGVPEEFIVPEAETSLPETAPSAEEPDIAPTPSSPTVLEEEQPSSSIEADDSLVVSDAVDAETTLVEAPSVDDAVPAPEAEEPIAASRILDDQSQELQHEKMDVAAESTFIETLSVPPKLEDEPVQEITLPEKPQASDPADNSFAETSVVEPNDDPAESPLFSSFIKPQVPGVLDIPSDGVDASSAEDGPTPGSLLSAAESEIERPKSPWTPSYSVITQGPGTPAADEEEIAELPALPPSINASADAESAPIPVQAEPTVTVTETEDEQVEVPATDIPRPWTPSYSVVVQGSPLISPADADVLVEDEPVVELQQEETLIETSDDIGGEEVPELQQETLMETSDDIGGEEVPAVELQQETLLETSDDVGGEQPPLSQSEEFEEDDQTLDEIEFAANPDPAITALIQTGVIVDPSSLQDPDVEDDSVDPASEGVVAALIESGVLTDSSAQDDAEALVASVPAAQDAIPDIYETQVDQLSSAIEFEAADDVPKEELSFDRPVLETLLTAVPSEPERPGSPWTPSYSVTQQGWEGDGPVPVPPPHPEMFTSQQEDFVKPTVDIDVSALEAPLDPPRASSPWTPSYSVSVQGSPLPVSTELTDSVLAEDAPNDEAESAEQNVDIAAAAAASADPFSELAPPKEIDTEILIESTDTTVEPSTELLDVLDAEHVPAPVEITPEILTESELFDVLDADPVPTPVEITLTESAEDIAAPSSDPVDVEASVADEVREGTESASAPVDDTEKDSTEVAAEPIVVIAEVETPTVIAVESAEDPTLDLTVETPAVEESKAAVEESKAAEDIEVAEPIAVPSVEISPAAEFESTLPAQESSSEHLVEAPVVKETTAVTSDSARTDENLEAEPVLVAASAVEIESTPAAEQTSESASEVVAAEPVTTAEAEIAAPTPIALEVEESSGLDDGVAAAPDSAVPSESILQVEPDEVAEIAESEPPSAEAADLDSTLVQAAAVVGELVYTEPPQPAAASIVADEVVAVENPPVHSSGSEVAVSDAVEQETSTEVRATDIPASVAVDETSPPVDEPSFTPEPEQTAYKLPTVSASVEDTPAPRVGVDLAAPAATEESAKQEPILHTMANLAPSREPVETFSAPSPDLGTGDAAATAEAIVDRAPERVSDDKTLVTEDIPDPISTIDAVKSTEEKPVFVQTGTEVDAPVQEGVSDVDTSRPPIANLAPPHSTEVDDSPSVELNTTTILAPTEAELVSVSDIDNAPILAVDHAAATADDTDGPADVSISVEEEHTPVASGTPVAAVTPLPADSKPQAFPLMVDTSKTPDDSEEADTYPDELPISPRSRLESTASSLFFPGGWFSKVPEGRASLDIAQGEFTAPKPTSPSIPSLHPSMPSPTTETTTETHHEQEKKGKWCVVM